MLATEHRPTVSRAINRHTMARTTYEHNAQIPVNPTTPARSSFTWYRALALVVVFVASTQTGFSNRSEGEWHKLARGNCSTASRSAYRFTEQSLAWNEERAQCDDGGKERWMSGRRYSFFKSYGNSYNNVQASVLSFSLSLSLSLRSTPLHTVASSARL